MVVSFTSNIALAKPDESELALNWARTAELQADNNAIIIAETQKPVVFYNPTIIAHTANPNLGTGFIQGEYQDLMGFIVGSFSAEFFDAGISAGTGAWGFRLPFVVDNAYHVVGTALTDTVATIDIIGEGYMYSNASVGASGSAALDVVTIGGVSYARMLIEAYATKTQHTYQAGSPFTVANNDKFTGSFAYKKA